MCSILLRTPHTSFFCAWSPPLHLHCYSFSTFSAPFPPQTTSNTQSKVHLNAHDTHTNKIIHRQYATPSNTTNTNTYAKKINAHTHANKTNTQTQKQRNINKNTTQTKKQTNINDITAQTNTNNIPAPLTTNHNEQEQIGKKIHELLNDPSQEFQWNE
jgi:hypothetical protein